jgi:hypothetical protein
MFSRWWTRLTVDWPKSTRLTGSLGLINPAENLGRHNNSGISYPCCFLSELWPQQAHPPCALLDATVLAVMGLTPCSASRRWLRCSHVRSLTSKPPRHGQRPWNLLRRRTPLPGSLAARRLAGCKLRGDSFSSDKWLTDGGGIQRILLHQKEI